MDVLCGIGIKKVACGTQFSVALTKDGNVYTFGQGKSCAHMDFHLAKRLSSMLRTLSCCERMTFNYNGVNISVMPFIKAIR